MPGFPKALARTIHELRLAGVHQTVCARRAHSDPATGEISARLAGAIEVEFDRVAVDDRAALFGLASAAVRESCSLGAPADRAPDVPLDSTADAAFVAALAAQAPDLLATVPEGDSATKQALAGLGAEFDRRVDDAGESTDLFHLRRHVFSREQPPTRARAGDVHIFSAPGEGREAVEIVRHILDEAERGVPFDEMAVFLRTPQHYLVLLEHACARAGVPAYFDRGVRRPVPSAAPSSHCCRARSRGLSAQRFDEYLSLGQVPRVPSHAATSPGHGSRERCSRPVRAEVET